MYIYPVPTLKNNIIIHSTEYYIVIYYVKFSNINQILQRPKRIIKIR